MSNEAHMNANIDILQEGKYRAVVHDGKGNVRLETAWGKNLILGSGFDKLLNTSQFSITCVAGSGNTTPLISDTLLATYKGKATTQALTGAAVFNTTPDANGYVTMTQTIRSTFNPGSLGSGAVNIAEAGMAMNAQVNTNSATQLLSRGLLVDGGGSPTTVSLDASTEYLDIYWQRTVYVKDSVTVTKTFPVEGVNTNFDCTIRPAMFGTSHEGIIWNAMSDSVIIGYAIPQGNGSPYTCFAYTGSITSITTAPTGSRSNCSNANDSAAYSNGTYYRDFTINQPPTFANLTGGIGVLEINCGESAWQIEFSPKLAKTADNSLQLVLRLSMGNK